MKKLNSFFLSGIVCCVALVACAQTSTDKNSQMPTANFAPTETKDLTAITNNATEDAEETDASAKTTNMYGSQLFIPKEIEQKTMRRLNYPLINISFHGNSNPLKKADLNNHKRFITSAKYGEK